MSGYLANMSSKNEVKSGLMAVGSALEEDGYISQAAGRV